MASSPPPSATATTQPQQPPPPPTEPVFPPAEIFDIIPQVHDLLARLLPVTPTADAPAPPPPLQPKDVDTEAIAIRQRIARARNLLADTPDINRSIEEQEAEIRELEAKVAKQKEILGAIREMKVVKEAAAE